MSLSERDHSFILDLTHSSDPDKLYSVVEIKRSLKRRNRIEAAKAVQEAVRKHNLILFGLDDL